MTTATTTTATSRSMPRSGAIRRPRAIGVLVAAGVIALASYAAGFVHEEGSPLARPDDRAQLTAPGPLPVEPVGIPGGAAGPLVPGSVEQLDRAIATYAANVAAEPRDFYSATTLAALYHARGRLTGDLADQERALETAMAAEKAAPDQPEARSVEAAVRFTLHDFAGALAIAEALYRDDPSQLAALAIAADAKLELGRIAEAGADYETLAGIAGGPPLEIRLARLAYVTGDAGEAVRLSRAALAETKNASEAGETVDLGFYTFAAAEYARLAGETADARAGFAAALALRDTDLGALVGLARIHAFEGTTAAAIDGLRRAAAIEPQPETLALLGDLEAATGDAAAAGRQFDTVRFVERLGEVQSTVFDRVLLRFELDHGGASEALLGRARASLVHRPDASGHDTVAWALYRLGRFDEAAREIAQTGPAGQADARIAFHAGAIALVRGDASTGRSELERALRLGPALDPIERAEARRLLGS